MKATTAPVAYSTKIAHITDTAITASVTKPDSTIYGVTLTGALCTCSCKGYLYHQKPCRHMPLVVQQLEQAHLTALHADQHECSDESEAAVVAARQTWARAAAWVVFAQERVERGRKAVAA